MTTVNTVSVLTRALSGAGERGTADAWIGVRREIDTGADIFIRMPTRDAQPRVKLERAAQALATHPAVSIVRTKRNRIELNLKQELIDSLFKDIAHAEGSSLSPAIISPGQQIVVDFFDPTATKAMHIGHLRNSVLGTALGSLAEGHGASVSYQSIVGDMGRSVAESISAYLTDFAPATPDSSGFKPDHFVGRCYAAYLAREKGPDQRLSPADEPIARELHEFTDAADQIGKRWLAGDLEIRSSWRNLIAWVLEGHRATLAACGMPVPTPVFEADNFDEATRIIERGLASGLFIRNDAGRVSYPTGRQEYLEFPLLRADRMPTQHLRTTAAWAPLIARGDPDLHWIHILGDEWRISTECRLQIFRQLGYQDGVKRYRPVFHGMVTSNRSKISSSGGDAILVDDELTRMAALPEFSQLADEARLSVGAAGYLVLGGFLLSAPPLRPICYSRDLLLSSETNPGIVFLRALARSMVDCSRVGETCSTDSPQLRYLLIRAQLLPTVAAMSWQRLNPEHLLRYLSHLCHVYLQTEPCQAVGLTMRTILLRALNIIGFLRGEWQLSRARGGHGRGSSVHEHEVTLPED